MSPLRSTLIGAPGIAKQVTYAGNPLLGGHYGGQLGLNGVVTSTGLGGVVSSAGLTASTIHGHPGLVGSGLRYDICFKN